MANQSLARAINYFAVFRIGEVELVDTAQKLCKEECYLPWYKRIPISFLTGFL